MCFSRFFWWSWSGRKPSMVVTIWYLINLIKDKYGPIICWFIYEHWARSLVQSRFWTLIFTCLSLQLHHRAEYKHPEKQQMDKKKQPRADITVILIGAITSAINQYFKVAVSPSGVVCESLGNHYHGLRITSISQVSVNNPGFKNW